jgi:hypothetical protein
MATDSLIGYYVILASPVTRSNGFHFVGVRSRKGVGRLGTIRQLAAVYQKIARVHLGMGDCRRVL